MIISRYQLVEEASDGKVQRAVLQAPMADISLRNLHAIKAIYDDAVQEMIVEKLISDISSVADPIIVAGDFNLTQENDGYKELREWLQNAHEEAGVGFGFTFPTPVRRIGLLFPLVRIDHLFVSRHFCVTSFRTLNGFAASDHYPITATLTFDAPRRNGSH